MTTHNAALRNHGFDILGRERLLKQVQQIDLERVEEHITGDEELVWLAEPEELEGPHQLLVLFGSFTHFERDTWPLGGGLAGDGKNKCRCR